MMLVVPGVFSLGVGSAVVDEMVVQHDDVIVTVVI
jgi:hypothetical protein